MPISLKEKYIRIHKQGIMPIFVGDNLDAIKLAEVCVEAGFDAIELTCRRKNALSELEEIKKHFPDLLVLAGSTVDSPKIVEHIKRTRPDMPSLSELAACGADGFVAQLPFMPETFEKYASNYILTPGVSTIKEAYEMLQMGAHFTKFCNLSKDDLKKINGAPVHNIFPLFIVGGVTLDKIDGYIQSGAALLAAGWDIILGEGYAKMKIYPDYNFAREAVARYKNAVHTARKKYFPEIYSDEAMDSDLYIKNLIHYNPF